MKRSVKADTGKGMHMEIQKLEMGRVRIALTAQELAEMDLTYDTIDCGAPETQALICALLAAAHVETGFDPASRLLAEFYPDEQGCVVVLSDADAPVTDRPSRQIVSPVIYAFEEIDTLIAGAVGLFARCSHRVRKSSLYAVEQGWRLTLYPLDTVENITLGFMDEYAPRCGEGETAAAALAEHATMLIEDNAVDLIASYFG